MDHEVGRKRVGRPKRVEGETLDRLTINISPKIKRGLELLARAQHRSLSQAVEWAIQVGLNAYEVSYGVESLGDLVNRVWQKESEPARTLEIFKHAPALLSFDDMSACEAVEYSVQAEGLRLLHADYSPNERFFAGLNKADATSAFELVVRERWDEIKAIAFERADLGQSLRRLELADLLMLPGEDRHVAFWDYAKYLFESSGKASPAPKAKKKNARA